MGLIAQFNTAAWFEFWFCRARFYYKIILGNCRWIHFWLA